MCFRLGADEENPQLSPVEVWAGNVLWNVRQQQGAALIPLILTGTLWLQGALMSPELQVYDTCELQGKDELCV